MKIILDTGLGTDNVTNIISTSSDAAFPVTNLQNDFTTDLWKAASGVKTATLSAEVSKGCALELLNTNAIQAIVTVRIGSTYDMETGYAPETGYAMETATLEPTTSTYNLPGSNGRLWVDHVLFTTPYIIDIALTAEDTLYAGILRAGSCQTFKDPARDNGESSEDYSIEVKMNNGSDYFRKGNIVRTFDALSLVESRANAFLLKHKVFDAVGPKPLAIRLMTHAAVPDDEFIIFAKRISPPRLTHLVGPGAGLTQVTFDLREVI